MKEFFKVIELWNTPHTQTEITKALEDYKMKVVGPPINQGKLIDKKNGGHL